MKTSILTRIVLAFNWTALVLCFLIIAGALSSCGTAYKNAASTYTKPHALSKGACPAYY